MYFRGTTWAANTATKVKVQAITQLTAIRNKKAQPKIGWAFTLEIILQPSNHVTAGGN